MKMPNPNLTLSESDDIVEPAGPTFKIFSGALKAFIREDANGVSRKMLSCTASSTSEDLHGDNMSDACVMDMAPQAKAKSMTIFLNHSYKWPEDIAGKTVDARVVQRMSGAERFFDLDLEIELNESNPRAVESWSAIKEQGIKAGISIGAMIKDYAFKNEDEGFWGGLEIKAVDLLEASIVGIPANQRSWVVNGIEALGAPKAIIRKAVGLPEKPTMKTKDAPPPEPIVEQPETKVAAFVILDKDGNDITDTVTITSKDVEVDITLDGTVTLAGDDAAASPDETETPEPEPSEDDPAEDHSSVEAAADAVATLKSTGKVDESLLEIVMSFLEGATEEVASLRKALLAKDEELAQARQDAQEAVLAVEALAKTPIGRKAQFAGQIETFQSRYSGLYDEGLLKLLDERTPNTNE
jgi:hypothetical protein